MELGLLLEWVVDVDLWVLHGLVDVDFLEVLEWLDDFALE